MLSNTGMKTLSFALSAALTLFCDAALACDARHRERVWPKSYSRTLALRPRL